MEHPLLAILFTLTLLSPATHAEHDGKNFAVEFPKHFHELIPGKHHDLVKPFVRGPSVLVMANELAPILGHLPGWYSDRHPNLAGYNVIADETARYLARLLRQKK